MDPTLFEDYAPAAPAKPQRDDDAPELVPYLHFAWLCNVLAGVAAPLGDSYETFAVDGDAQGSSSAPPDGPDDDPLVPYGAFKFVAEAVGAAFTALFGDAPDEHSAADDDDNRSWDSAEDRDDFSEGSAGDIDALCTPMPLSVRISDNEEL